MTGILGRACYLAIAALLFGAPFIAAEGPVVTDALGRTIRFSKVPERIAIVGRMAFFVTDVAYMFPEARTRLVGIGKSDEDGGDFIRLLDPTSSSKAVLESSIGPEEVVSLRPDAVVLNTYMADRMGKILSSVGIPVVYVDFETPDQFLRDTSILGSLFGDPNRAREITAYYQSRIDMVKRAVGQVDERQKPNIVLLNYTFRDGRVAFNVPPLAWMQTWLIRMAGAHPVWQDVVVGNGWMKVGFEQIVVWDPDQVFVAAYTRPATPVVEELKSDTHWQRVRAVRQNRLYAVPGDFYSWDQPDTRWILGLMWIASSIYPEKFGGLDMRAEVSLFYEKLYGQKGGALMNEVTRRLKGKIR